MWLEYTVVCALFKLFLLGIAVILIWWLFHNPPKDTNSVTT